MILRATTFSRACKGQRLRAPGWNLLGERLTTKHT